MVDNQSPIFTRLDRHHSRPFGRRTLLRGAGVLGASLVASTLAGCDYHDDALTFFFQANPEEANVRMRIIDEFQRRHPDIKVRTVRSGGDPMQQMLTFCAGGKCPDVLMAWELTYAALADRGVLLDLNTILPSDPTYAAQLKSDSVPVLYDTFGFKGGQYAFPEQWSGTFLFFNRKLFDEANLRPPGRWDDAWSFAEFLECARVLTKRDESGKVTQWGFVDTWAPYYSAGLFGMNNGAGWSIPWNNPGRMNFDDDAFIEGVQFYADLANKYRVAPTAADQQSTSTTDLFSLGRAAMALAPFRAVVAQRSYRLAAGSGHQAYTWATTNLLLGSYAAADGIKTGFTAVAGYCLLFEAKIGDSVIIGVVLDSTTTDPNNRFKDATTMLNWGFAHPAPQIIQMPL